MSVPPPARLILTGLIPTNMIVVILMWAHLTFIINPELNIQYFLDDVELFSKEKIKESSIKRYFMESGLQYKNN